MTDIAHMPAGAEMDRMVASKVMGRTQGNLMNNEYEDAFTEPDRSPRWIGSEMDEYNFEPSTNIAHAWEVLEQMGKASCPMLFQSIRNDGGGWWCNFHNAAMNTYGETAPLAICRAALMAVGEE